MAGYGADNPVPIKYEHLSSESAAVNMMAALQQDTSNGMMANGPMTGPLQTDPGNGQSQTHPAPAHTLISAQPVEQKPEPARLGFERRPQEFDANGNYEDRKKYTITQQAFNRLRSAYKIVDSGIRIHVEIGEGGPEHWIEINRIPQQGIGAHVFRCPDIACDNAYVRRHLVEDHFNKLHADYQYAGITYRDHVTMSTFNWQEKHPNYHRRSTAELDAERAANNGDLIKKRYPKRRREAVKTEDSTGDDADPGVGPSNANATVQPIKKAPRLEDADPPQPQTQNRPQYSFQPQGQAEPQQLAHAHQPQYPLQPQPQYPLQPQPQYPLQPQPQAEPQQPAQVPVPWDPLLLQRPIAIGHPSVTMQHCEQAVRDHRQPRPHPDLTEPQGAGLGLFIQYTANDGSIGLIPYPVPDVATVEDYASLQKLGWVRKGQDQIGRR